MRSGENLFGKISVLLRNSVRIAFARVRVYVCIQTGKYAGTLPTVLPFTSHPLPLGLCASSFPSCFFFNMRTKHYFREYEQFEGSKKRWSRFTREVSFVVYIIYCVSMYCILLIIIIYFFYKSRIDVFSVTIRSNKILFSFLFSLSFSLFLYISQYSTANTLACNDTIHDWNFEIRILLKLSKVYTYIYNI